MDPEIEQKRLVEQYAAMNDLELEDLAGEWESLTETAHEVLMSEMARRGLKLPEEPAAAKIEREDAFIDPVAVGEFHGWREALLAWGLLNSGGIQGRLTDSIGTVLNPDEFGEEYAESIAPGLAGPITLQVSAADSETAREVLKPPDEDVTEPEE